MYKYLMMNLAINETSALPIGIRICDFNIGLYGSKKISEVPALMALVNYTLFKYSSYESEELEDICLEAREILLHSLVPIEVLSLLTLV